MKTSGEPRRLLAPALALVLGGLFALPAVCAGDSVLLRYKHRPGAAGQLVMTGNFEGSVTRGDAAPTPMTMAMESRMSVRIIAVDNKGIAAMETKFDRMAVDTTAMKMKAHLLAEEGKVTFTVNDQPAQPPALAQLTLALSQPVKSKIDARGRVWANDSRLGGVAAGGLDPAQLEQLTVFPEKPVAPGAKWSDKVNLPFSAMGDRLTVVLNCSYTYDGLEEYQGRRVARITFKGSGEATATDPAARLKHLTVALAGHQLFDQGVGADVSLQVHVELKATMGIGDQSAATTLVGDLNIAPQ